MEAYNHLECEYIYRAAVKGSSRERKSASKVSGHADRTCGQVLDCLSEAVSGALALAPEDLRREYGSDCLRLYLLFMGSERDYRREEAWDEDTMAGLFRYLGKVWRKWGVDGQEVPASADRNKTAGKAPEWDAGEVFTSTYRQIVDQTLQGRYHAGLTMLMSLLKRKTSGGEAPDRQSYLHLLLPYAPCLSLTLLLQDMPAADLLAAELWDTDYAGPAKPEDGTAWIEIPMQYNGKLYSHIRIREDAKEEEAAAEAVGMLVPKVTGMPAPEEYPDCVSITAEREGIYQAGGKRYTVYYIPGRIINICDQ
ncbi:MAG: hypothetical protein IK087_00070 [Lachnospiraceae bacterium]|nr:hypothetical protein [Lachnospiraceae bacterium]